MVLTKYEKFQKFKTLGRISKEFDGKIIKDENEELIIVKMATYFKFIKAGGGYTLFILLNVTLMGLVWCKIQLDFTIGEWVLVTDKKEMDKKFGEFVFLSFSYAIGYAVSIFFNSILVFVIIGIKASRNIHN